MAAIRPIQYDWVEEGRPSLEDQYRLRQRERGHAVPAPSLVSNPLSAPMAGFRVSGRAGGRRLGGGTFAPRATSGML